MFSFHARGDFVPRCVHRSSSSRPWRSTPCCSRSTSWWRYSITDLVGACLILWGFYASQRAPTADHPFGFGKERFFWAFMASFIAFTIAGLVVLVTGLERVYNPTAISDPFGGVVVVGISLAASVGGIVVALYELRQARETVQSLM
ncbi:MAG: cation transporter, partial [Thermoplasmatales archaeon]|nr:cation transporter [Thermoplasmatales archaeon]